MKIVDLVKREMKMDDKKSKNGRITRNNKKSKIDRKVIIDSITKLDPRYLAKNNAVMFTVEVGFIVTLIIASFPSISTEYILHSPVFYLEKAIILILTVWFATFSESRSEAQA